MKTKLFIMLLAFCLSCKETSKDKGLNSKDSSSIQISDNTPNDSVLIVKASWESTDHFEQLNIKGNILSYQLKREGKRTSRVTLTDTLASDLLKIDFSRLQRKDKSLYKDCSAGDYYYLLCLYKLGDTIKFGIPIEYVCDSLVDDYYISVIRKIEHAFDAVARAKLGFCDPLNMDSIRFYYPEKDITSGRMNKPGLLRDCNIGQKSFFGFYNLIDQKSRLKPAVVAMVLVSFEEIPWLYSDNQEITALIVNDKLFKYNPFPFSIGDSIKKAGQSFNKERIIGEIAYFRKGNCMIAIKSKEEIILKYIVWSCESLDDSADVKHSIVEDYLK